MQRWSIFLFLFSNLYSKLCKLVWRKINKNLLKPEALVSDAADAIKNAFQNASGNPFNHVMCWAHAKRKIENRLSQK